MNCGILRSNTKNTGGEAALEGLSDRESLRLLRFIQRMILEKKCRSEIDHQTIPRDYALRAVICWFDQLLTLGEEVLAARKGSASDVSADSVGGSDDV
jgi:hypothetical protein